MWNVFSPDVSDKFRQKCYFILLYKVWILIGDVNEIKKISHKLVPKPNKMNIDAWWSDKMLGNFVISSWYKVLVLTIFLESLWQIGIPNFHLALNSH